MCATCGCSGEARVHPLGTEHHEHHEHHDHHEHSHPHDHPHPHHEHPHDEANSHEHRSARPPGPGVGEVLHLERRLLARNDELAEANRRALTERGVLALNLVSSPGAGKTTLLERTLHDLGGRVRFTVIEGDQETALDAERIRATGTPAVQVNTGTGCHLDASMVERALHELVPPESSVLMIENVGNLVCPALFDLGEHAKVLVASVTEGEDKPLKYPHLFRASEVVLLNKVDLLPHVRFDVERFLAQVQRVNPRLRTFPLSATRGDGLEAWYAWLDAARTMNRGVGDHEHSA